MSISQQTIQGLKHEIMRHFRGIEEQLRYSNGPAYEWSDTVMVKKQDPEKLCYINRNKIYVHNNFFWFFFLLIFKYYGVTSRY